MYSNFTLPSGATAFRISSPNVLPTEKPTFFASSKSSLRSRKGPGLEKLFVLSRYVTEYYNTDVKQQTGISFLFNLHTPEAKTWQIYVLGLITTPCRLTKLTIFRSQYMITAQRCTEVIGKNHDGWESIVFTYFETTTDKYIYIYIFIFTSYTTIIKLTN